MERDEKRKKFHDALLKIYLPPSSPTPKPNPEQQIQPKEEESLVLEADLKEGTVDDDVERVSSPSSDGTSDDDSGSRKLSRAQRKRIRKRKLKEAAAAAAAASSASRRKIIGPLLPFDSQVSGDQEMPSKDQKS